MIAFFLFIYFFETKNKVLFFPFKKTKFLEFFFFFNIEERPMIR